MKATFFFLRAPIFPYDYISYDHNQTLEVFNNPVFKEAILISSPDLYHQLNRLIKNEISDNREEEKIFRSLSRFLLRMSYRSTPFGLFAGTAVGRFCEYTNISLGAIIDHKKASRLDSYFLSEFVASLTANQNVFRQIKWFPNNTIYYLNDRIRYVDYKVEKGIRSHTLADVQSNAHIETLLKAATEGAKINDLVKSLINDNISIEDATYFIKEVIESRLLISELEPRVTGREYHQIVIDFIKEQCLEHESAVLLEMCEILKTIDSKKAGAALNDYHLLFNLFDKQNLTKDIDVRMQLQTDVRLEVKECALSGKIEMQLRDMILFLARLSGEYRNVNLENFKEEFRKRYETQQVSLVTVMDPDIGIGYPSGEHSNADSAPLVEGILKPEKSDSAQWGATNRDRWLVSKLLNCMRTDAREILLTENDIPGNRREINPTEILAALPRSFYSLCCIVSDQNNETTIVHDHTIGPSAANLLGRFCHADPNLTDRVKSHIALEESGQSDTIFAEVVHLSQSRQANVLMRPVLRKYEIPILTRNEVDREHVINLGDLMLSLEGNDLVLFSRRCQKRVIPRMSTAHNYSFNSLPLYHFLCDLQSQEGKIRLDWDWGILKGQRFLPRVTYKKNILSVAQWTLYRTDFLVIGQTKCDFSLFEQRIQKLVGMYNIPNRSRFQRATTRSQSY